jgi:gamma-tubulin complex component 2
MVVEDKSLTKETMEDDFNARYWDNRFTMRSQHVPSILRSHAMKALITGKYLSVVRDCQSDSRSSSYALLLSSESVLLNPSTYTSYNDDDDNDDDGNKTAVAAFTDLAIDRPTDEYSMLPEVRRLLNLHLELKESSLSHSIDDAYVISSRAILKLLDSRGLRSHLKSIRRFFLLEHGDFFTQFMDSAEEELRRDVRDVVLTRVQGLLQIALQTSTLLHDPHKEELSCTLASHNLIQHLHLIQVRDDEDDDDDDDDNDDCMI